MISCTVRCTQIRFIQKYVKIFFDVFLHSLKLEDEKLRLEFCLWVRANYLENKRFHWFILFTDESRFCTI